MIKEVNQESIKEIVLSGDCLPSETKNLDIINKFGQELFIKNKEFIKSQVPDNWYIVIEPTSCRLIASLHPNELYNYTINKFPNKLFFIVGFNRNYFSHYV